MSSKLKGRLTKVPHTKSELESKKLPKKALGTTIRRRQRLSQRQNPSCVFFQHLRSTLDSRTPVCWTHFLTYQNYYNGASSHLTS